MDTQDQAVRELLEKTTALNEQLVAVSKLLQFVVKVSETSLPALQAQQQEIFRLAQAIHQESELWQDKREEG